MQSVRNITQIGFKLSLIVGIIFRLKLGFESSLKES